MITLFIKKAKKFINYVYTVILKRFFLICSLGVCLHNVYSMPVFLILCAAQPSGATQDVVAVFISLSLKLNAKES